MCFNGGWHRLSSMSQSLGLFSADMVLYVIVVHSIFFGQGQWLVQCLMKTKKFCANILDTNKNCTLTIKKIINKL